MLDLPECFWHFGVRMIERYGIKANSNQWRSINTKIISNGIGTQYLDTKDGSNLYLVEFAGTRLFCVFNPVEQMVMTVLDPKFGSFNEVRWKKGRLCD